MKKIISMLLLLPLIAMVVGCTEDPIVFDHEKPQFELNDNAVLLEVIMPTGSLATDTYYIVGDFNGGMDEAIGNPVWQLQKAANNDSKWGIYLIPSTFQDGKTLADGYYFYSEKQREERTVKNEAVLHKLENAQVGQRYNSWVDRWAAYFDSGSGEEEEEGLCIYVQNKTTWGDAMALYAWANDAPVDAGWPGWQPTGKKTVNGIELVYWNMKNYEGATMNLIFNNNDGGKQVNGPQGFTMDRDLYVNLTDDSCEEFDINNPYNGFILYVQDLTGWPITHGYGWRTQVAGPTYPGWEAAGTKEVNGVNYLFFRPGEQYSNQTMNVLFNDGADKETTSVSIKLDQDRYFKASADGTLAEIDPNAKGYNLYVENKSDWAEVALHYWGTGVTGTSWPGLQPAGTDTFGDVVYLRFELPAALADKEVNFILNNNGNNVQLANGFMTVTRDQYYRIPANPVHNTTAPEEIKFRVYVDDQSGWGALALYGWGYGDNPLGGWPGMQPSGTKEINSVTYTYFELPADASGNTLNLIFNNNGGGTQIEGKSGMSVKVQQDFYFRITSNDATVLPTPNAPVKYRVYVDNQSGWSALALYAWGTGLSDPLGGWGGMQPSGTKVVGTVTYTYFELPIAVNGKSINLIFNNNGGGSQIEGKSGMYITVTSDFYFRITATDATVVTP